MIFTINIPAVALRLLAVRLTCKLHRMAAVPDCLALEQAMVSGITTGIGIRHCYQALVSGIGIHLISITASSFLYDKNFPTTS